MTLTISSLIAEVMPNAIASGLFVSLFSAFAPSSALEPGGEVPPGKLVPVPSVQNVPCMIAPPSNLRLSATEQKTAPAVLSLQFAHVLLSGYYPQIPGSDADWDAVITNPDGSTLVVDVVGAEVDSQSQMTRVSVRIAQE